MAAPSLLNRHMHNQMVINEPTADQLSAVFAALADPTRRAILERLAAGEATVGELGAPFAMSQPAISKHIKVLEGAGLVSRRRQGTANLSRLEPDALREADDWLERYRAAWEERFERLDEVLDELRRPQP
jgi:DNA-binding transcriptional ArsR family regulator